MDRRPTLVRSQEEWWPVYYSFFSWWSYPSFSADEDGHASARNKHSSQCWARPTRSSVKLFIHTCPNPNPTHLACNIQTIRIHPICRRKLPAELSCLAQTHTKLTPTQIITHLRLYPLDTQHDHFIYLPSYVFHLFYSHWMSLVVCDNSCKFKSYLIVELYIFVFVRDIDEL